MIFKITNNLENFHYNVIIANIYETYNFLNKEALDKLYSFCLSNSIWNEFDYKNGYIGSFIESGFNSPLIMQISEEIKERYPNIFKNFKKFGLYIGSDICPQNATQCLK